MKALDASAARVTGESGGDARARAARKAIQRAAIGKVECEKAEEEAAEKAAIVIRLRAEKAQNEAAQQAANYKDEKVTGREQRSEGSTDLLETRIRIAREALDAPIVQLITPGRQKCKNCSYAVLPANLHARIRPTNIKDYDWRMEYCCMGCWQGVATKKNPDVHGRMCQRLCARCGLPARDAAGHRCAFPLPEQIAQQRIDGVPLQMGGATG